jgi:purine-binding chemotaxis protein CheW
VEAGERQLCTFALDGHWFGVEVRRVQELIREQPMTPVPLAAAAVAGLMNLRGQIVTAVDMRRRLGLPEWPAGRAPVNVIVRSDDGVVALLVDEVGDVLTVAGADFEAPPATLRGAAREFARGAYKLPDRLLLALDLDRVLDLAAPGAAAPN